METVLEKIFVDIPRSEMTFFKHFADKMGWMISTRQNLWDEYADSCPKDADLSDDDIMSEVKAARYGKL